MKKIIILALVIFAGQNFLLYGAYADKPESDTQQPGQQITI